MKREIKILYLDENLYNGNNIIEKLNIDKLYKIELCNNLETFEKEIKENDYNIILSEFYFKNFTGFDILKIIKNAKPDIPFIFITDQIDDETEIKIMKQGAFACIQKNKINKISAVIDKCVKVNLVIKKNIILKKLYKQLKNKYDKLYAELRNRIRELDGMYEIYTILKIPELTLREILERIINVIPHSFKFPNKANVRILYNKQSFLTENFNPSKYCISSNFFVFDITKGVIEIYYSDAPEGKADEAFSFEEKFLLDALSDIIRRIIENKISNEVLKESEEKYKSIVNNTMDIICSYNTEGIIQYISYNIKKYGYDQNKVIGNNIFDFIHNDDRERVKNDIIMTIESYNEFPTEYRLLTLDGNFIFVEERRKIIKENNTILITSVIRDITDRIKMEKDLIKAKEIAEEASKARQDFLTKMTHDIRTPLNGIIGIGNLVFETNLNSEQKELMSILLRSGDTLLRLINDLLDYSKSETLGYELIFNNFNIYELAEEVIELLSKKAFEKNIDLTCFINPEIPEILNGDENKIKRVLINLVSNAVKFTNYGIVQLKINKVWSKNDKINLLFEITDTGQGISKKDRNKLFKPFSQIDTSLKNVKEGVGLGLAICKKIVDEMSGSIGVDSEIGKGSRFWFEIVLTVNKENKNIKLFKNIKIIIVGENQINFNILYSYLKFFGCSSELYDEKMHENFNLYDIVIFSNYNDIIRIFNLTKENKNVKYVFFRSIFNNIHDELMNKNNIYILNKPIKFFNLYRVISQVINNDLNLFSVYYSKNNAEVNGGIKKKDLSILIVEDDDVSQKLLVKIINKIGYKCQVAVNGLESIELCSKNKYDLILMDLNLPVLNGYEAAAEILKISDYSNVIIIAITAFSNEEISKKCYNIGMKDIINKPINKDDIFKLIDKWFK